MTKIDVTNLIYLLIFGCLAYRKKPKKKFFIWYVHISFFFVKLLFDTRKIIIIMRKYKKSSLKK